MGDSRPSSDPERLKITLSRIASGIQDALKSRRKAICPTKPPVVASIRSH